MQACVYNNRSHIKKGSDFAVIQIFLLKLTGDARLRMPAALFYIHQNYCWTLKHVYVLIKFGVICGLVRTQNRDDVPLFKANLFQLGPPSAMF